MSPNLRLKLGITLLILGLVMPAGTLLVGLTDWSATVKGVINGVLLFGFEIMTIPAVALMGKENYDRIVNRVKAALKSLKPAGNVGRTRYTVGLILFVGPLLFSWIAVYVPALLPGEYAPRVWVNVGLDLLFLVSLFVLGGDFWDKLQALFIHDARAVFIKRADPHPCP